MSLIGSPIDRTDGRAKVTGTATYAAEFQPPGLVFAVAISSTIPAGRIRAIEAAPAAGLVAVLTHENMTRFHPLSKKDSPGMPGQTFFPLQSDEIQYAGQYVALVIAETLAQAQHAASLIKVSYEPAAPEFWQGDQNPPDEKKPAKVGRDEKPDSLRGDPEAALKNAPLPTTILRQTYLLSQENHNPMEMSAAIAAWNGDKLTLYTTTQHIYGAKHLVAKALGISEDNIKVICPFVGGAFGCKGSVWPHEFLAAAAAKLVGKPVKFELTRPQMFTGCGARPMVRQDITLAADSSGKLLAMTDDEFNHTSLSDNWSEGAARVMRILYSCPNVRTTHRSVPINTSTPAQMRAPGEAPGTWALEMAMDELAYALKMDPLELRLKNYADTDEDTKKPFSSKALKECYAQAAEKFGWHKRSHQPRSMRDGPDLLGWGMATATYPSHQSKASVRVRILNDANALLTSATHDLGTGTYTIMTQIAADTLGLPLSRVKFELGNSLYPQSPVAGGSQTAASVGSAVRAACLKARQQLFAEIVKDSASPFAGKNPQDLDLAAGRITLKDHPNTSADLADIMRRRGSPIDVTLETGPTDERKQFSTHAHGAQFVEVRINPGLPEVKVTRVVSAFAAGTILNHKTARSQVMGAIVMGLGAALLERTIYDQKRVRIINDNLADYLVPVNADIPDIDCFFVHEPDPHINPLGVKGIGELGITGIAAAVANAVFHATGKRQRHLPITLENLL